MVRRTYCILALFVCIAALCGTVRAQAVKPIIIKMLDGKKLTVRAAHAQTGIAAADFSRIRNADLGRFTLDRLVSIINRLGSRIEVHVNLRDLETFTEALASIG